MSSDVESMVQALQEVHESWATAIELGLGLYLLSMQVGIAAIFMVLPALGKV
jgi:hypothetical protein